MTVIIFLLVLAVLIFVHELGHFIAARACGIRVDAFAVGFGPKLISWKRGETRYSLNLIPFGGYVKIFGENPDAESITGPDAPRSFINKAKWQQVIVLAAGVFFNFIFAWMLYIITFAGGITAATEGYEKYTDRFENVNVMITYIAPDSPAEKAGLMVGDIISKVDSASSIEEIQNTVDASKGAPVTVEYVRDDVPGNISVSPTSGLVENKYAMGIAMENVGYLKLPIGASIIEGTKYTGVVLKNTAQGLGSFFLNIFKGEADFSEVAGPVGIAGVVGNAAQKGIIALLWMTAIISINLGIINLVPFPALDGGRILFVAIEAVIRRAIPMKFANAVNAAGFALLMLLMVVVTYKDIAKLIK
jgi:regulator of sigma E protease